MTKSWNNRLVHLAGLAGLGMAGAGWAQLPDLAATDVTLNANCQLLVTIRNLGPGPLPELAFQAGSQPNITVEFNGQQLVGGVLSDRALQQPGGSYTLGPTGPVIYQGSPVTIRVRIDTNNLVNEANENNNLLQSSVTGTCPAPGHPDLALTKIGLLPIQQGAPTLGGQYDCRASLELKNIGAVALPDGQYTAMGPTIDRTIDGVYKGFIFLKDMDPGRALQNPGGTLTWQDYPQFAGKNSVRYEIRRVEYENNTANNVLMQAIPPNCGQPTAVQRLAPTLPRQQQMQLPTPSVPKVPSLPSKPRTMTVPTTPPQPLPLEPVPPSPSPTFKPLLRTLPPAE